MCVSEQSREAHRTAALQSIHQHHHQQLAQMAGGAVAVIHPTPNHDSRENPGGIACRLHLYPQPARGMLSYAVLSGATARSTLPRSIERCRVFIHTDGDLSRSGTYRDAAPLVEFPASAPQSWRVWDEDAGGSSESIVSPIAAYFEISVGSPGNAGIIGRRVSIIDPHGCVAGDGVIGWN